MRPPSLSFGETNRTPALLRLRSVSARSGEWSDAFRLEFLKLENPWPPERERKLMFQFFTDLRLEGHAVFGDMVGRKGHTRAIVMVVVGVREEAANQKISNHLHNSYTGEKI